MRDKLQIDEQEELAGSEVCNRDAPYYGIKSYLHFLRKIDADEFVWKIHN